MRVIIWFVQTIFAFTGLAATYIPLWFNAKGENMWGLAWQYWAMIGVTILWFSMLSIIIRLWLRLHYYTSKEGKLRMEQLEREVAQQRSDQHSMDTGKLI